MRLPCPGSRAPSPAMTRSSPCCASAALVARSKSCSPMAAKKLVLAYSGGLDTSVAIRWLKDQGWDVIAFTVDLGEKKEDRKSTRLNSSHEWISYAVFCLKKKNTSDIS